jgi:hypothetical protein
VALHSTGRRFKVNAIDANNSSQSSTNFTGHSSTCALNVRKAAPCAGGGHFRAHSARLALSTDSPDSADTIQRIRPERTKDFTYRQLA